jgi:hypothetical protein
LDDERRRPFPDHARRYFQTSLGVALDPDRQRYQRIVDLYAVRNLLRHANGRLTGLSSARTDGINAVVKRRGLRVEQSRGLLMVNAEYASSALDDVSGSLRDLVARARARRGAP